MKRKNMNSDGCVRTFPLTERNLLMLHQFLTIPHRLKL